MTEPKAPVEEAVKEAFLAGIDWWAETPVAPLAVQTAAANIYARNAMESLAALAQPKEATLYDEEVERAARADADMAAALLEGLEALANTPMNIDLSVWSRFAFNVQMIAKRLRNATLPTAHRPSREEIGRIIALAGLGRTDGSDRREKPNERWTQEEWEAGVLEVIPTASAKRCLDAADAILNLFKGGA